MRELDGCAWLAIDGFQNNLYHELSINPQTTEPSVLLYNDIIYREGPPPHAFWHRCRLDRPFIAEFESIREASQILRSIQRNWALYPFESYRRATLIQDRLPKITGKPRSFPFIVPQNPMGIWTLLDKNHLFASAETSSPFPLGEARFEEDRINPPSRAYLKMYEALAWVSWLRGKQEGNTLSPDEIRAKYLPGSESRCVDAGACPGGWTWALTSLGAQVTAIDRSELDPRLMADPRVTFVNHDAFTLTPQELGRQDWVFSDVICYPPRLYEWILKWLESGLCENFICTIKMQGAADHETTRAFAAIPGSTIVHLTANKNELTWIRLSE